MDKKELKIVIEGADEKMEALVDGITAADGEIDDVRRIAENAYATANNAYGAANNAQTTGNLALTYATLAQTQATTAQTSADAAHAKANQAYTLASQGGSGSGGFDPDVETIKIGVSAAAATGGVAVGSRANAGDTASISIGKNSATPSTNCITIGPAAGATKSSVTTPASYAGTIVIGDRAGYSTQTTRTNTFHNAIAIGTNAKCLGNASIVIGNNARVENYGGRAAIVIGNNACSNSSSTSSTSIIIGDGARTNNSTDCIVIGERAGAINNSSGSIIIGELAECWDNSRYNILIGSGALADEGANYGVAIGERAELFANNSIAIGRLAGAHAQNVIAIGYNAKSEDYQNATIIGRNGRSYGASSITITDDYMRCWTPVAWTTYSDKRDKTDIAAIEPEKALDFVELLNPVTYRKNSRMAYVDMEADAEKDPAAKKAAKEMDKTGITQYYDHEAHERGEKKSEHVIPGLCAQEVADAFVKTYGIDNFLETHLVDFSAGFEYDKATGALKNKKEALKERLPEIKAKAAKALAARSAEKVDVMEILKPESEDIVEESKFSLSYEELIPYLIGSIKQLSSELKELKSKVE